MIEEYDGRQVVGMDLHLRRSVLVRMTADGRRLGTTRINNSPAELRNAIGAAGPASQVVQEATYGWHWAADVLAAACAEVHLARLWGSRRIRPAGSKAMSDAGDLADLLRMGRLPEAWITPPF